MREKSFIKIFKNSSMKNGINEAYALVQLQLEGFILHY